MKHKKAILVFSAMLFCASMAARPRAATPPGDDFEPALSATESFMQYLQNDPLLSDNAHAELNREIEDHIHNMLNWQDKAAYAADNNLQQYVDSIRQLVQNRRESSSLYIENVLQQYYNMDAQQRVASRDSMQAVLDERLGRLDTNLNRLSKEIESSEESLLIDWENLPWKWIGTIGGGLLLLFILLIIISKSKKKKKNKPTNTYSNTSSGSSHGGSNEAGIVVRRKTATILKKQSLEDVIDNPNYMQVDAIDFCYESAVRRMYIKNTCVIDIYNMYANDLRNPDTPKEDGCMVLGRWVHDPESNEYYVSLEEIVLPGDDAVFEEYALNFGGKIKLKVLELLRKLRRETNLQYDLTCWVHSHPGLGVFFSNSDVSVQMQLKHPTHPNFLTAIVVDILTPMQELGIFTFQRDATINSKNDLKKMYSLIEWYQWAKDSLQQAPQQTTTTPVEFKSADYYNTLEHAKQRNNQCYSVQLSKNVVVDMCMALTEKDNGIAGMIHGMGSQRGMKTELAGEQLSENADDSKQSLVGCFVVAPHCSIPTVRRAVADMLNRIKFVVVYTPGDGLLTTIPVVDNDLVVEEAFYGEQRLEDLKQWIKQGRV